jgi:hypothetical protein
MAHDGEVDGGERGGVCAGARGCVRTGGRAGPCSAARPGGQPRGPGDPTGGAIAAPADLAAPGIAAATGRRPSRAGAGSSRSGGPSAAGARAGGIPARPTAAGARGAWVRRLRSNPRVERTGRRCGRQRSPGPRRTGCGSAVLVSSVRAREGPAGTRTNRRGQGRRRTARGGPRRRELGRRSADERRAWRRRPGREQRSGRGQGRAERRQPDGRALGGRCRFGPRRVRRDELGRRWRRSHSGPNRWPRQSARRFFRGGRHRRPGRNRRSARRRLHLGASIHRLRSPAAGGPRDVRPDGRARAPAQHPRSHSGRRLSPN